MEVAELKHLALPPLPWFWEIFLVTDNNEIIMLLCIWVMLFYTGSV